MRVCVTGGRTFTDTEWLHAGLDMLHAVTGGITEIIEGGATGADVRAGEWADRRGVKKTVVPAEWEKYSAGLKHGQKNPAGVIRNSQLVKLQPDIVLACPGGNGTDDMVKQSKRARLKVIFLEKMPIAKGVPSLPGTPSDPTEGSGV